MKHQLLKYGIRDGVELHISTVEHGLKCNSTCPCCGMILIAKKGRLGKPQSHFAHKNLEQCEFAYETSIHYEAKRLLEKEKRISLPYRIISFDALKLQKSFQPHQGGVIPEQREALILKIMVRSEVCGKLSTGAMSHFIISGKPTKQPMSARSGMTPTQALPMG